jgi:hypothetical protein
VLFLLSYREFRRAGTSVQGSKRSIVIVRTGPYRFSRNPIYLAFILLVLGLSVWLNNLWLLVTLVPMCDIQKIMPTTSTVAIKPDSSGRRPFYFDTVRAISTAFTRICMANTYFRSKSPSFYRSRDGILPVGNSLLWSSVRACSRAQKSLLSVKETPWRSPSTTDRFAASADFTAQMSGTASVVCDRASAIHSASFSMTLSSGIGPIFNARVERFDQFRQNLEEQRERESTYRRFILDLYHAKPMNGHARIHEPKSGRMVHVGAVVAR